MGTVCTGELYIKKTNSKKQELHDTVNPTREIASSEFDPFQIFFEEGSCIKRLGVFPWKMKAFLVFQIAHADKMIISMKKGCWIICLSLSMH
jgi:hypothetical protein